MKMQIGISFISVSKSISQVGVYGSLIGFAYTVAINIWSVWLMLQTRNKFKDDHEIIDVCDLSVKLYGEWARKYLAVLLVVSNCLFGMAYEVYLGSQLDQLMCQTLQWAECGHSHVWAAILSFALLPIVYLKRFKNIGYFSLFNLILTFVAVVSIFYVCIRVLS